MRGGLHLDELHRTPEGWTARVRVPDDAAVFEGHFPDRPLLPGVALLLMVADVGSEAASRTLVPVRLRRVRFLAPVGPAATLRVRLREDRFTVHLGDLLAAEGALALAPPTSTVAAPATWPEGAGTAPVLPHRGPARLVERVREGWALARFPARSPLALEGAVPACAVLEAAAQGARGEQPAGETEGMLVRVEASLPAALLPVEHPFALQVTPDGALPPLHRFRARALLDEEALTGTVTLKTS